MYRYVQGFPGRFQVPREMVPGYDRYRAAILTLCIRFPDFEKNMGSTILLKLKQLSSNTRYHSNTVPSFLPDFSLRSSTLWCARKRPSEERTANTTQERMWWDCLKWRHSQKNDLLDSPTARCSRDPRQPTKPTFPEFPTTALNNHIDLSTKMTHINHHCQKCVKIMITRKIATQNYFHWCARCTSAAPAESPMLNKLILFTGVC